MAHRGFCFDFPILFAEVERHLGHLPLSSFVMPHAHIHFADTHSHLRQLKNAGADSLKGCSLGFVKLFEHFFPTETYSGTIVHDVVIISLCNLYLLRF